VWRFLIAQNGTFRFRNFAGRQFSDSLVEIVTHPLLQSPRDESRSGSSRRLLLNSDSQSATLNARPSNYDHVPVQARAHRRQRWSPR
jgi:hypothetical protein